MMGGENGETAQAYAAVQGAASGERVDEAVEGGEAIECQVRHRGADLVAGEGRLAAQERAAHTLITKFWKRHQRELSIIKARIRMAGSSAG